jgi:hypothetical protein
MRCSENITPFNSVGKLECVPQWSAANSEFYYKIVLQITAKDYKILQIWAHQGQQYVVLQKRP